MLQSLALSVYQNQVIRAIKLQEMAHKLFTIGLVLYYYSVIQKVPIEERLI
jgi:hypothetical protein